MSASSFAPGSSSPLGGGSGGLAPPPSVPIGKSTAMSILQLSAATRSLDVLSEDRQTTTYDLLHGRLTAWRTLIKMFAKYVQMVASIKSISAVSHRKAAEMLAIPTGSGDEFKQESGILVIFVEFQKLSRTIAADEANSSINMEASVVKELRRLKREVKARTKSVATQRKKQAEKLTRDETALTEAIKLLTHGLDQYVLRRPDGPVPADPWLMNHAVRRQIDSNVAEQIATHNKMLAELESYVSLETAIMETLRSSIKSFSELWQSDLMMQLSMLNTAQGVISELTGSTEYEDFAGRNKGKLVQRKPEDEKEDRGNLLNQVGYDNRDHPLCATIKTGRLMKKRPLTGWKESYWVLTGSGWLHSFTTSDILRHPEPEKSVFVSGSQLGPHSQESDPNGFELIEQAHHVLLGRRRRKHRFRGVTYAEAMEWWKAVQPLAATVLDRMSSDTSLEDSSEDLKPTAFASAPCADEVCDEDRVADTRGEPAGAAEQPPGLGKEVAAGRNLKPPTIEVHSPLTEFKDTEAAAQPPPQIPPSPSRVEAELRASAQNLYPSSLEDENILQKQASTPSREANDDAADAVQSVPAPQKSDHPRIMAV